MSPGTLDEHEHDEIGSTHDAATAAGPSDDSLPAAVPGVRGGPGASGAPEETPIHLTRTRTNSVAQRPRHLDSPPPPAPPPPALLVSGSGSAPLPLPSPSPSPSLGLTVGHPASAPKRLSLTSSSLNLSLSLSAPHHPAAPAAPVARPGHPPPPIVPPPPLAPAHRHKHKHAEDAIDDRRHPRDLVPLDIGFPVPEMHGRIKKDDLDDRLLMATCAILRAHENRALCPKEVAEVMFERNWLHNAGSTPFAHVSTCIRSHLRRAKGEGNNAAYPALILPFDLTGALTPPEIRAVGLRADERPAVKRGTLWYLNEAVLGVGLGCEDPFIRCRREAGLEPSELNGVYVRTRVIAPPPPVIPIAHATAAVSVYAMEDDDDESGMGRGKRKRRASSAMMAATEIAPSPLAIPSLSASVGAMSANAWPIPSPLHRRANSTGSGAHSLPTKSAVPRLRLRLTSLEEVDSGVSDSDGQTSDAQRRRKNKKKARRAASEGTSRGGSVHSLGSDADDDDSFDALEMHRSRPAFSSAASSALLAQSLLAASTSTSAQPATASQSSVVSPNSLHFASGPFNHRHSHLSMSAPNLFSAFSAANSPDTMEIDDDFGARSPSSVKSDSADEDDFHEAMLRGDDFDFEWGSESYESAELPASLPPFGSQKGKGKVREMSISLGDQAAFDDMDAASTPATTPRSPAEEDLVPHGASKMGMDETLCEAFAAELDRVNASQDEDRPSPGRLGAGRAGSGNSLASLVKQEQSDSESVQSQLREIDADEAAALAVPLPSPLALELSPLLHLAGAFSTDYDFIGHEDDDRSHYRSDTYDRDMAESADDEDEDDEDDIVTVKIEDEGLDEPLGSGPSSRQSSVFPLDSFSRRIMMGEHHHSSPSASSESGDSDSFDPHMIVSAALLASGLPVPQVAPSPPDTSDWGMHLDLDDLDLDLGDGADLLGPETVGLEELDLAWGGPAEQREDETDAQWRDRTAESRAKARGFVVGPTFLTGPAVDAFPAPLSQRERDERTRALIAAPAPLPVDTPSPISRADTPSRSAAKSGANGVIVYPKIPLSPIVTATIIQGGIAVYATTVVDSEDNTTYPLFRRIDTDYINGSVLLQVTFTAPDERDAILLAIPETFRVLNGDCGIAGTWVPLAHARVLVTKFPALAHLVTFLDDELGSRFPEPIPSMRAGLRAALATSSSSVLGYPPLADAYVLGVDRSKPAPASTTAQRNRKPSTVALAAPKQPDESTPTPPSVRKTRRSAK